MLSKDQYTDSLSIFNTIPAYRDSSDQIKLIKYELGKVAFENKYFEQAVNYLSAIGSYEDSEKYIRDAYFSLALQYLSKGENTKAVEYLKILVSYKDTTILEKLYLQAKSYIESNQRNTSIYILENILDYKDSLSLLNDIKYSLGTSLFSSNQFMLSYDYLMNLGDYKDTQVYIKKLNLINRLNGHWKRPNYSEFRITIENSKICSGFWGGCFYFVEPTFNSNITIFYFTADNDRYSFDGTQLTNLTTGVFFIRP